MNSHIAYIRALLTAGAVLMAAAPPAHAYLEMAITPQQQSASNVCWAACCSMVLDAYGETTTQQAIMTWAVAGQNVGNEIAGGYTTCDEVLYHYAAISTNPTLANAQGYGNLSAEDVVWELDDGRPIMAVWQWLDTYDKHMLLISGYTGSGSSSIGNIIYLDPLDGARHTRSYAEFVQLGVQYRWHETLRMYTNPRTPIPLGTGPDELVWIDYGTTAVYPSTQSLTYYAFKNGSHTPTCWHWRLMFPYSGGDCVVASWNSQSSSTSSTWNISGFSMPSGYDWIYNFSGNVVGRVEVTVDDVQSPPSHYDAMNVVYIPSVTYPGHILFADETVGSSLPDVVAHETVTAVSDIFSSGGDIALKAGTTIYIGDGITVQNGSATDFVVDPSLR